MYSMSRFYYKTFLPMLILTVIVSQQNGTSVQTKVESTTEGGGTSEVHVQTNVDTTNSESKGYKREEVDVNGTKKVYESNEPGSTEVNVTSDNKNGVKVSTSPATTKIQKTDTNIDSGTKTQQPTYKETSATLREYVMAFFKSLLKKMFSV